MDGAIYVELELGASEHFLSLTCANEGSAQRRQQQSAHSQRNCTALVRRMVCDRIRVTAAGEHTNTKHYDDGGADHDADDFSARIGERTTETAALFQASNLCSNKYTTMILEIFRRFAPYHRNAIILTIFP